MKRKRYKRLTNEQKEDIVKRYNGGIESIRTIADSLNRAYSTVHRILENDPRVTLRKRGYYRPTSQPARNQ